MAAKRALQVEGNECRYKDQPSSHRHNLALCFFLIGIGKIGNCQQESGFYDASDANVLLIEIHLVQRLQHVQMARTLSSLDGLLPPRSRGAAVKILAAPTYFHG